MGGLLSFLWLLASTAGMSMRFQRRTTIHSDRNCLSFPPFFSSLRSLPNRDALSCYESEPIAFTFLILALSPHQWHRLALITPSVASLGPFHPINGSADCGHLKRVWCDFLSELRSCVKVEVAALGSRPLYAYGFCGRKATLQRSLSALPVIVGRSSLALRR